MPEIRSRFKNNCSPLRGTKAVAQAKQGQWLNWEGVEKKKLIWKELWSMEKRSIRFFIGATYDVLPTPQNLKLWVNGEPLCSFRYSGVQVLQL